MKRILGLLAVAALLAVTAATSVPAQALTLATPGIAAAVQDGSKVATTEVRFGRGHGYGRHHGWHRHHGYRGGRHHHRRFR